MRLVSSGQTKGHTKHYVCDRRARRVDGDHGPLTITQHKADGMTWELVRRLVEGRVLAEASRKQASAAGRRRERRRHDALTAELAEVDRQVAYNLEAARAGALPVALLADQQAPLLARREQLARDLERLGERARVTAAARLTLADVDALVDSGDIERQRTALAGLFARVEIHRDRLVYVSHFEDLPAIQVAKPAYCGARRGRLNLHIIDGG